MNSQELKAAAVYSKECHATMMRFAAYHEIDRWLEACERVLLLLNEAPAS